MKTRKFKADPSIVKKLRLASDAPSDTAVERSRARVTKWFLEEAPLIQWAEMKSPLGRLFVAVNRQGLCDLDFGRQEVDFLERLDPRARLEKNPQAAEQVVTQLREYFAGERFNFHLRVDISRLTPFQRSVLEIARGIAPGKIWTYHQIAEKLGRPHSSRPVGQALARNPVPIVIPCHRVIASNGSLGGYSGGSGLEAKRWLLRLEGAM